MSITYKSVTATTPLGTTSVTIPYPPTITAGDIILLFVAGKYDTTTTPTISGFTFIGEGTGGAGSAGIDSGTCKVMAYYRIADGSETGNVVVTLTGGSSWSGQMANWSLGAGEVWETPVFTIGAKNSGGSTSLQMPGADNLNAVAGDHIFVAGVSNSDLYTLSSMSLSVPGCSTSTTLTALHWGNSSGQDTTVFRHARSMTGGPETSAPVWNSTASGSTTNSPAGVAIFVRLRASTPPPPSGRDNLLLLGVT